MTVAAISELLWNRDVMLPAAAHACGSAYLFRRFMARVSPEVEFQYNMDGLHW